MVVLAQNKKAFFDYQILEKFEAGIALKGLEVKSVKAGWMNLAGTFVTLKDEEVFLVGAKIRAWQPKNAPPDYNPARPRKLLLRKSEIRTLIGKVKQRGLTLVPLRVYTKQGKIKIEIALVKSKRQHDKRELIKKREAEREMRRMRRERS